MWFQILPFHPAPFQQISVPYSTLRASFVRIKVIGSLYLLRICIWQTLPGLQLFFCEILLMKSWSCGMVCPFKSIAWDDITVLLPICCHWGHCSGTEQNSCRDWVMALLLLPGGMKVEISLRKRKLSAMLPVLAIWVWERLGKCLHFFFSLEKGRIFSPCLLSYCLNKTAIMYFQWWFLTLSHFRCGPHLTPLSKKTVNVEDCL